MEYNNGCRDARSNSCQNRGVRSSGGQTRPSRTAGCQSRTSCTRAESKQDVCRGTSGFLSTEQYPLVMAYVPSQEFEELYDWNTALRQGTIFRQLDYPFQMTCCRNGGGC